MLNSLINLIDTFNVHVSMYNTLSQIAIHMKANLKFFFEKKVEAYPN